MSVYTFQPGADGIDTYIVNGSSQNVNFGTQTQLLVGTVQETKTFSDYVRSLLLFDISSVDNFNHPIVNHPIVSATLTIYNTGSNIIGTQTFKAHSCNKTDWAETGATWNIYKVTTPPSPWTYAGGDYSTLYPSSCSASGSDNLVFTNNMKLWCDDAISANGLLSLLIKMDPEIPNSGGSPYNNYFGGGSSDHAIQALRPKLVIRTKNCGDTIF